MLNQEKKRNPSSEAMMLDLIHIGVGVLVVICAIVAFLNPEKNRFLFPVIFWLAAFLNGVSGWYRLRDSGRDRKKKISGIALCAGAGLLVIIGILSAISIRG